MELLTTLLEKDKADYNSLKKRFILQLISIIQEISMQKSAKNPLKTKEK